MITKNPLPKPLLYRDTKADDIFVNREEAMKKYRERVNSAVKGKKAEHA